MSVLCYLHIPPFPRLLKEPAHLNPNALSSVYGQLLLSIIISRRRCFEGLFDDERGGVGVLCWLPAGAAGSAGESGAE